MKYLLPVLAYLALAMGSGCAYIKPSKDAQAKQRYETYGPKFTDEQKASMSTEEKVAVYNNEVRKKDRVVCSRQRTTGSHFRQTTCYTREEIDDAKMAADEFMRDVKR